MDFMNELSGEGGLKQSQALLIQMEVSPLKENLKNSLELLQRNAFLLGEIKRLANVDEMISEGKESNSTLRTKYILEVNSNLLELARTYSALADTAS